MATPSPSSDNDAVAEIRREMHDLAVLSSALLRLATKVQARCDALRQKVGGLAPLDEEELKRHVALVIEPAPAGARSIGTQRSGDENEPAALLAMSLAGEGMSRAQIGAYLRDSFGMHDADELLDRVLPRVP